MKKLILILLVGFLALNVYGQDTTYYPEKDTSLAFIEEEITDVADDIKGIGSILEKDYEKYGFVGFVRFYKYFIVTFLIFIFLTILWFRNRN